MGNGKATRPAGSPKTAPSCFVEYYLRIEEVKDMIAFVSANTQMVFSVAAACVLVVISVANVTDVEEAKKNV